MSSENENFRNQIKGNEPTGESRRVDAGEKSDESSTNVSASFSCEECGKTFGSRQELKEHTQVH
jgi:hypothetical protein